MREILECSSTGKKVLSYIVRNGAASRKEISEHIGVTTATLTRIVAGFLEQGVLRELGTVEEGRVGRKQVMLDLCPGQYYVMGFDVTNIYIRLTLMDLHTEILEQKRWNFSLLTQEILDEAMDEAERLLIRYTRKKILGLGLLLQGYLEGDTCFSLPIPNIKAQLENRLGTDVFLMNNVRGLAVAESYFGNPNQSYLVVKYGPGVGCVIVQNGEILDGSHHRAGELGHILWDPGARRICPICGKRGCLESIVGYESILQRSAPDLAVGDPDLETVLRVGEPDGYKVLYGALKELAMAVSMAVELVDLERILLAGQIFQDDRFFSFFLERLTKYNPSFEADMVCRIDQYLKKRVCAAGVVVLNHYFGGDLSKNAS